MGLLDYFIDLGALTIVTTHHGILKNYGYTKPGCLNASMEFDSTRLAPTYRIVMGIPARAGLWKSPPRWDFLRLSWARPGNTWMRSAAI
jgi:hypothetical protein